MKKRKYKNWVVDNESLLFIIFGAAAVIIAVIWLFDTEDPINNLIIGIAGILMIALGIYKRPKRKFKESHIVLLEIANEMLDNTFNQRLYNLGLSADSFSTDLKVGVYIYIEVRYDENTLFILSLNEDEYTMHIDLTDDALEADVDLLENAFSPEANAIMDDYCSNQYNDMTASLILEQFRVYMEENADKAKLLANEAKALLQDNDQLMKDFDEYEKNRLYKDDKDEK